MKRRIPPGARSCRSARSPLVNVVPARPVMKARTAIGADQSAPDASVKRSSVVGNHALAAGGLVARAELAGLVRRCKWSDHGPIEYALAAKLRAADDRLQAGKLARQSRLRAREGGQ